MNFLVLGCNGMAGHVITLYLKEQGHRVIGFAHSESPFVKTIIGDAFNVQTLHKSILAGEFDAVVNCIGILNLYAEKDKAAASFLNGYLPHYLTKVTAEMTTRIIHLSTDCVFSGKMGGYTEKSLRDGDTFYDRSKALGEIEDEKNLTLRNSIIGPDMKEEGIGLLNWFMKQNREVDGYAKVMWTGQTTLQLAKTIEQAVKKHATGLVNMVPSSNISKYELLKLFNRYLRNDELAINPVENVIIDKTLVRTNFDFDYDIPNYETMIREMAEWIFEHKKLYPHYKL